MTLLNRKRKNVCVIGCGKLGLPLVATLANAGHSVVGIDLDKNLVSSLSRGVIPWFETSLEQLMNQNRGRISFHSDFSHLPTGLDFALVIVPSPSDSSGMFIPDYVKIAIRNFTNEYKSHVKNVVRIVIVSTLMPGATDEIQAQLNQDLGNESGKFELIYSPEFIALGSVVHDMSNPDLVLIGSKSSKARDAYMKLVKSYVKSNPEFTHLSPKEAEIAKIAVNSYVTTKISFANFISELCDAVGGASADRVLKSVGADSRIGRSYLKPGAAYGGPCFPRDNRALSVFAMRYGLEANLASSTHEINQRQTYRLKRLIKSRGNDKKVAIIGMSYKPGTAVIEESPSLLLHELLKSEYEVSFFDHYVTKEDLQSIIETVTADDLEREAHCLVVMVPDAEYDKLVPHLHPDSIVIDCWGRWEDMCKSNGITYSRLGSSLE